VALARLGRRDAAAAEIERALGLDPRGLAALYARGVLKGETDDPETAQKLFRRLLAGRKLGIGRPSTPVK
jgi:Flp pilus assembly protein TadD